MNKKKGYSHAVVFELLIRPPVPSNLMNEYLAESI
jgi:hypothetical protein